MDSSAKAYRHQASPWLKRVLVPFWVVQMIGMIIILGVIAWLVYEVPGSALP